MKKIYYAHSNQITNSPDHRQERAYLEEEVFPDDEVIDPSRDTPGLTPTQSYVDYAMKCDIVLVTEFLGFIGRGVYTIVASCLPWSKGLPKIFVMRKEIGAPKSGFFFHEVQEIKLNNLHDWSVRYGVISKARKVPAIS